MSRFLSGIICKAADHVASPPWREVRRHRSPTLYWRAGLLLTHSGADGMGRSKLWRWWVDWVREMEKNLNGIRLTPLHGVFLDKPASLLPGARFSGRKSLRPQSKDLEILRTRGEGSLIYYRANLPEEGHGTQVNTVPSVWAFTC